MHRDLKGLSRLTNFVENRHTDGGKDVSHTRRPPLTPGRFLVLVSVIG
jgi:hypothetical protein